MSSSTIESQNYEVLDEVLTDGDIPVTLYRNKITGLKVVTAYVENPIVKADITFATEAFDDDGLPHTLEHLVFLGSEDYPYKGVLDLLANRCLSNGTNACTDTDNTNYTVSTAGSDGFLNLLPIYLDHLLFPTLTEAGYITEVHHINGDGEDAGVVYCEMQAKENSGDSRCYHEMLRSMYPGKCGYKSETGGLLENLRTSTNHDKVCKYHKQYYHSKNVCVIVTGPVKGEEIFQAIKRVEDKIVKKGMHELEFERPWQTPVEPLNESCNRKIQYSSDTDDDGLVYIGYRGPNAVDNFKELIAISILLEYLDSTAISPIQREFVECDEPYCSSVSHSIIENTTSCFYITFDSVGKEYLDHVQRKLHELLDNILKKNEKFDIERLQTIISRKILQILSVAENSPHSVVIGPLIGHFLYGTTNLAQRCQEIPILKEFAKCEQDFWLSLIEKYFLGEEARYVCIVGEPSPVLMREMADKEKERIKIQREKLKDQLPAFAEKLRQAVETNELPAPKSLLTIVDVPSTDSIKFHSVERVVLGEDLTPFRLQYDSIKTNFVTINLLMDTSHCLTTSDRLYLPLLTEMMFESPIERNGEIVPYETIVSELFSDTISYGACIGISAHSSCSVGVMGMLFNVAMQVEVDRYEKAVEWYRELLYSTIFTPERLKTVATRLRNDLAQSKRSGSKVLNAASNGMIFKSNSNQHATNFMRQRKFLKQILKDLVNEPEKVQKDITKIHNCMTRANNILVHLTLDKEKIDVNNVHKPWLNLVPKHTLEENMSSHIKIGNIIPCHELVDFNDKPKSTIIGIGSVESNYMHQFTTSINSPKDPDLPALYVLLQYLTQLEGPLWRNLRGLGLSYSYSIHVSPSDGLIFFTLHKSSHVVAAYKKALDIVTIYLSGEEEFEDSLFDSAKSSLIFEFIKREKSPSSKSLQSLLAYLRDLEPDFNKNLIKSVAKVTKEDLRRVGERFLKPLFDSPERRVAVCCNSSKVDEVMEQFKSLDCNLEQLQLEESPIFNSLE